MKHSDEHKSDLERELKEIQLEKARDWEQRIRKLEVDVGRHTAYLVILGAVSLVVLGAIVTAVVSFLAAGGKP
jgi:hypothetical protein